MIDGTKIKVNNTDPKILLDNPLLKFHQMKNIKTGEVTGKIIAKYQGLRFIIDVNKSIYIQGSLHKYFNGGKHNHNDFGYYELMGVFHDFMKTFQLNLRNCTLVNLEIGANFTPVIPAKEILTHTFLHQKKEFKTGDFENGHYKQATFREYVVKIYDKGLQYNLGKELLRFEVKLKTNRIIKSKGVHTLVDLIRPIIHQKLANHLLECWYANLMYDPTFDKMKMPFNKVDKLYSWSNPIFWSESAMPTKKYRNRFRREVNEYKQYQEHYSENLQHQMAKVLFEKLVTLMPMPEK